MRFLRRQSPAEAAPGAEPPTPSVDQITVFFPHGITEGWIESATDRPSDTLNAGGILRVRLPAPDDVNAERWGTLPADEVIALAVSPHAQPSPRRMARRRHVIELVASPYRVSGTVHMPPGADPARYARSTSHRWLPLTRATIAYADDSFEVEVLLVNLDHVQRL